MIDANKRESIRKSIRMEQMSLIIPYVSEGKNKMDPKMEKAYKDFKRPAYSIRKE
jgi:hypothetical protein